MNFPFFHLTSRLLDSKDGPGICIDGVSADQWCFIWAHNLTQRPELLLPINLFVTYDAQQAQSAYDILKFYFPNNVAFYSGLDISPYSKAYVSESAWFNRIEILSSLAIKQEGPLIIVATLEASLLKMPPNSWIKNQKLVLNLDDIVAPNDLASQLVALGYVGTSIADTPGTFSRKGDIFDIFPMFNGPVRINYFDDLIEKIFQINPENQRTIQECPLKQIFITPGPHQFTQGSFVSVLRENLPQPETRFKARHEERTKIFSHLADGHLFENYPLYSHLFFGQGMCLLEHAQKSTRKHQTYILGQSMAEDGWAHDWGNLLQEFQKEDDDPLSSSLVPTPAKMFSLLEHVKQSCTPFVFLNHHKVDLHIGESSSQNIHLSCRPLDSIIKNFAQIKANRSSFFAEFFKTIKLLSFEKKICFIHRSENAKQELEHLLSEYIDSSGQNEKITFQAGWLSDGFYYEAEDLVFLSDADVFSFKQRKTKAKTTQIKNPDLFAEQMATLKQGDFVIHSQFGVGKYLSLESITAGGKSNDFLVLTYKDGDKVYVPVYKLNQIQKHSEADSETRVADLKNHKFDKVKARAKESAKKLAFDLLKLQAERKARSAYAFSPPDHLYHEFELAFPFEETPDQLHAIDDAISDMQKAQAMDRLVCGDVGFGKTEVAMRAAFKAVEDKKQVAILVPTTILALQHFHSFRKRFEKFPVSIEFLSRFKSSQESKQIVSDLKEGKIDIVIGTHKLLGSDVSFKDLGLLIVDEEQRFGVGHKEKIKLFKNNVDVLTLTATPIPRTLQLAFLGIRDLSLIQTAPPRRQSIKTFVIKEDHTTLSEAINREIGRGGQVFYVHNRVQDIEQFAQKIRDLAPSAKIVVAHGQMSEKDLESRMTQFYHGDFNVLLSTTIIESGLDIPNANTLIVDRADTYGLSQLHQLRGRIGRSDRKAFAYFVIPDEKRLTAIAERRLKALQTYAEMGSGFHIASSDLEIRGAGDILGAEQSGHIEDIGLELYLDLLQEAIDEIKGEVKAFKTDLEIQVAEPSFIPMNYIAESGSRLKYYKKLSNSKLPSELDELCEEIIDLFGHPPTEFKSLISVLKIRLILSNVGLKSLKSIADKVYLQFDSQILDGNEKLKSSVISTFLSRPKVYKITQGYGVIYTHKTLVGLEQLLEFSKTIAGQIAPC